MRLHQTVESPISEMREVDSIESPISEMRGVEEWLRRIANQ